MSQVGIKMSHMSHHGTKMSHSETKMSHEVKDRNESMNESYPKVYE